METMQDPREGKISCAILGQMSIQEKNNTISLVAQSTESIANKISTQNESPLPPETTKSKSEDEIFADMTVKMVGGIPECEKRYLLKIRIQEDITNTCLSINSSYEDRWEHLHNI